MTWQDVLDDIRQGLHDPSKERWSDSDLIQRVNVTRHELWGIRPEAFYVLSVVTDVPADPDDQSFEMTIDVLPTWVHALSCHVLWQCYFDDSDERQNVALADRYYAIWAKKTGV